MTPTTPTTPTSTATTTQSPGPSKVIASSAIRLYKYESSGYEAQAGGSPLGCVILGSGTQYQLLIYNAQVFFISFFMNKSIKIIFYIQL